MAGPNRPDDNAKDFSFLHAEPATSGGSPLMPDSDSFPQLPDVPPVLDASSMPGFTDLNFGDVPFSIPPDATPSFGSSFPMSADASFSQQEPLVENQPNFAEESGDASDSDENSSIIAVESLQPMLPESDPEMIDANSDDFNADSTATAEDSRADESFRMASPSLPTVSDSQQQSPESMPIFSSDGGKLDAGETEPGLVVKPAEPAAVFSFAAAAVTAAAAKKVGTAPTSDSEARASRSDRPKVDPASSPAASQKKQDTPKSAAPVSRTTSSSPMVIGYAIAVTLLLLFSLATGRLSLFGNAALENLPDIRPLAPNEFRKVPDGTPVPDGHVMKLGDSRRFGDVVVTPLRVTREPLKFQGFMSGQPEESLTSKPVLKLWLKFENQSGSYAFPPFDAGLMSHRTPPLSTDDSVIANSFLNVSPASGGDPIRVLNYLQTMDNNFVLTGQNSAKVVAPEESLETFIACSEKIDAVTVEQGSELTWRVQFRKGVYESTGNGVTTLIDVQFNAAEIQ